MSGTSSQKEGLIEARVNRFANLSEKIQSFINEKSALSHTPFYREEEAARAQDHRAKRSLTDWRHLYNSNHAKIQPHPTLYPSTADGFRARCSQTGQCHRSRKAYTAAKPTSSTADRNFLTRQTRRAHQAESRRESVVEFAIAQHCYEQEALRDHSNLTAKARKFLQRRAANPRQRDIARVGLHLSTLSEFQPDRALHALNATEKYLAGMRDFQLVQMAPYNLARIGDHAKIDNHRYLEATAHVRKGHSAEHGLRYYERA